MFENIQYKNIPMLSKQEYTYIGRDGITKVETEEVLLEHLIEVYINDILTMKLICLPEYLEELVLGRLLTEGMIHSVCDVDSIYICEYGSKAKVYLSREATLRHSLPCNGNYVETTPTCCTGNRILHQMFADSESISPVTPIDWKPEWIFHLADAFAKGTPLHEKTCATHSCFMAIHGEILFSCEDIGRHNALDKAIGHALKEKIPLEECILYSSGRIPTDMVMKAIRAGIPVLVSKASPTRQAIDLAKEYHLTLLCQARKDRMKRYA